MSIIIYLNREDLKTIEELKTKLNVTSNCTAKIMLLSDFYPLDCKFPKYVPDIYYSENNQEEECEELYKMFDVAVRNILEMLLAKPKKTLDFDDDLPQKEEEQKKIET